jgi:hypothetical protein
VKRRLQAPCVGEEPARPLGVAHWTERRKEREGRKKEAKFPFFILFQQNFGSSLPEICSRGLCCCPLDFVVVVEDETLVVKKRGNIEKD